MVPSANNYPKNNSDTVGQKRSRDEPHNNSASKHPSHDKQSDNSNNHSIRQNDGKKKGRNRKPGKNKQVDQTGSHDNSNKHGNKPSQQSINPNANSAVVYQTVPVFNPSPTQVQGKPSRHSSIDLGNPPPGMQYAIFPNGQHGWVPSTTQPIFLSPPSSHSAAPQPMATLPNSRSVQQYSNQQNQWRNDTTRGSSRGNTQSQFDNMIANAVSDSNAISTPYDNDNVDGSDYPYLADIFYTLVSEDVFTRIFAYYKFMNTDLLAAYYQLAENYEAVDFSRLCGNPYFFGQTPRNYDIVCYALTSTTVISTDPTSTTTSVDVEPPVVTPSTASAPTTTGLDLLSSVSAVVGTS